MVKGRRPWEPLRGQNKEFTTETIGRRIITAVWWRETGRYIIYNKLQLQLYVNYRPGTPSTLEDNIPAIGSAFGSLVILLGVYFITKCCTSRNGRILVKEASRLAVTLRPRKPSKGNVGRRDCWLNCDFDLMVNGQPFKELLSKSLNRAKDNRSVHVLFYTFKNSGFSRRTASLFYGLIIQAGR